VLCGYILQKLRFDCNASSVMRRVPPLLLALSVACLASRAEPPPGFFMHQNYIGPRNYSAFSCTNASSCPMEAAAACKASTCMSFGSSSGWKSGKVAQLYHADFNGSRVKRGWTLWSTGNIPPPGPAPSPGPTNPGPPPTCPINCAYNYHFKGCGVRVQFANGTSGWQCPKALLYSVGFDTDMVLQRGAKAAVYGQILGHGIGAKVEVTVSAKGGASYTVQAVEITSSPTYCLPLEGKQYNGNDCAANYSASWKVFLKPAAAGGDYSISAKCTAGCGTDGGARDVSIIKRVTFGGESNLPTLSFFLGCDRDTKLFALPATPTHPHTPFLPTYDNREEVPAVLILILLVRFVCLVIKTDVFFCSGQSNMALPNTHSYSAKSLQAQMLGGKFGNLRFFQYEGMSGGKIGAGGSYSPLWTRQTGSSSYRYPGNGTVKRTWFNASYAAAFPKVCPDPSADNDTDTCKHVDTGPFFKFSATCMEFGRSLIEQLGDDAPPIGLIQSAIGGTKIESWSANTTTAQCQNKTTGAHCGTAALWHYRILTRALAHSLTHSLTHSLHTHYTLTTHSRHTHDTLTTHSLTHSLTTHSLHTHYTLTTHSLHTHYTLTTHSLMPGGPSAGPPSGTLYYGMVCPFVNMTIAGFTWCKCYIVCPPPLLHYPLLHYPPPPLLLHAPCADQGENNMHGSPGSSLTSEGYGCMMAGMVAAWRAIWSAVPGQSIVRSTRHHSPAGTIW
jgi:hypothetical protein